MITSINSIQTQVICEVQGWLVHSRMCSAGDVLKLAVGRCAQHTLQVLFPPDRPTQLSLNLLPQSTCIITPAIPLLTDEFIMTVCAAGG